MASRLLNLIKKYSLVPVAPEREQEPSEHNAAFAVTITALEGSFKKVRCNFHGAILFSQTAGSCLKIQGKVPV